MTAKEFSQGIVYFLYTYASTYVIQAMLVLHTHVLSKIEFKLEKKNRNSNNSSHHHFTSDFCLCAHSHALNHQSFFNGSVATSWAHWKMIQFPICCAFPELLSTEMLCFNSIQIYFSFKNSTHVLLYRSSACLCLPKKNIVMTIASNTNKYITPIVSKWKIQKIMEFLEFELNKTPRLQKI